MEFKLRVQEFIELIRSDRRMEAIKHARKYFPSFEDEHLATIQQVMALLAFPINTGMVFSLREDVSTTSFVFYFYQLLHCPRIQQACVY